MLTAPIDLTSFTDEAPAFDHLYPLFERDFVTQATMLDGGIYVDPKGQGMRDGREEVFWHITTREQRRRVRRGNQYIDIVTRPLDRDRASRIEWIRPILLNYAHADVKMFYRKESKGKRPIRLYLWAHNEDFVVIVQKLGAKDAYLVTSFYITEQYKRDKFNQCYNEYKAGANPALAGCEWF